MHTAQLLNLFRHKATRPGLFGPRKMTMHIRSPLTEEQTQWGWRDKVRTAPTTDTNRLNPKYWSLR